ncbi:MAG TPA: hypothetical protein PL037_08635, partial [Elusimicrobiales bacterium]|nr:hypothetical protein [Elusimicrobiales bacterium]
MDARRSGIRTASALLLAAAAAGLAVYAFAYRFFYGMEAYEAVRKLQGLRIAVALFRQESGRMPSDISEIVRNGVLAEVP